MSTPRHASLPGSTRMPVRAPKTAELVAESLRRAIIRGELSPGDALPSEATLMEQFGISRPSLREAIRVLESESLITVRRGVQGGARVSAPSPAVAARYLRMVLEYRNTTVGELFELAGSLEPLCAHLLAERHSEADIERLHEILAGERAAMGDPATVADAHAAFHSAIVGLTGNRAISTVAETLQCVLAEIGEPHVGTGDDGGFRKDHEAHLKLVRLISAGKADEAERHWRRHTALMAKRIASAGTDVGLQGLG